jgi:hypothetical protein
MKRELAQAGTFILPRKRGALQRCGKPDGSRDILRTGAESTLLPSAIKKRFQGEATTHIEESDPCRSVELTSIESKKIDTQVPGMNREVEPSLTRIRVKVGSLMLPSPELLAIRLQDPRDITDALYRANLPVRKGYRDKKCLRAKGFREILERNPAIRIHWEQCEFCTIFHKTPKRLEYASMFDYRGDEMRTSAIRSTYRSQESQVITLSTPAREDYLVRMHREDSRSARACRFKERTCKAAATMHRSRVTLKVMKCSRHLFNNLRRDGSRGSIIRVDAGGTEEARAKSTEEAHHPILLASALLQNG